MFCLNVWKDEIAIQVERQWEEGFMSVEIWIWCVRHIKLEMPCRNPSGDGERSWISKHFEFTGEVWVGNINL